MFLLQEFFFVCFSFYVFFFFSNSFLSLALLDSDFVLLVFLKTLSFTSSCCVLFFLLKVCPPFFFAFNRVIHYCLTIFTSLSSFLFSLFFSPFHFFFFCLLFYHYLDTPFYRLSNPVFPLGGGSWIDFQRLRIPYFLCFRKRLADFNINIYLYDRIHYFCIIYHYILFSIEWGFEEGGSGDFQSSFNNSNLLHYSRDNMHIRLV